SVFQDGSLMTITPASLPKRDPRSPRGYYARGYNTPGGATFPGPLSPRENRCWPEPDRKSTRLNSSHVKISYAVFCWKKKKVTRIEPSFPVRGLALPKIKESIAGVSLKPSANTRNPLNKSCQVKITAAMSLIQLKRIL